MALIYPAPQKKSNALKFFGIEAVFIILVAIPVLVALNYFSIIRLPFLPTKGPISEEKKKEIVGAGEQPVLYACPLVKELCISGKVLMDAEAQSASGFGYRALPKGAKIFAIYDGTYTATSTKIDGKDIVTLVLSDTKKESATTYIFNGSIIEGKSTGTVKQRDAIGILEGNRAELVDFTSIEYALYVRVDNLITQQSPVLKPSADGKALAL